MNQRCAKERKYNDSNRRQHYFAFKLKENWGLNFCSEHLCVPKHIHITKMTSYKMMHFTKHYHYKSSTVRANLYFENLNRKPIFFYPTLLEGIPGARSVIAGGKPGKQEAI